MRGLWGDLQGPGLLPAARPGSPQPFHPPYPGGRVHSPRKGLRPPRPQGAGASPPTAPDPQEPGSVTRTHDLRVGEAADHQATPPAARAQPLPRAPLRAPGRLPLGARGHFQGAPWVGTLKLLLKWGHPQPVAVPLTPLSVPHHLLSCWPPPPCSPESPPSPTTADTLTHRKAVPSPGSGRPNSARAPRALGQRGPLPLQERNRPLICLGRKKKRNKRKKEVHIPGSSRVSPVSGVAGSRSPDHITGPCLPLRVISSPGGRRPHGGKAATGVPKPACSLHMIPKEGEHSSVPVSLGGVSQQR